jgi:uncharacterized iron-regulated membrane protein
VTTQGNSSPDRSSLIVTTAMVVLSVLGVITVFHEPLAALLFPPGAAERGSEPGSAPSGPVRSAVTAKAPGSAPTR